MNSGQHGFKGGRSCLSQLLTHRDHILQSLEEGINMDVVFLDFEKAFDKVDHGVLQHKIRELSITGQVGQWIHAFLSDRIQYVAVGGCVFRESHVVSGVSQGSVLGPLLFLILITDIDAEVCVAQVASFADDMRVSGRVSNEEEVTSLQQDLNSLYCWANENNLTFISCKFELIRYGQDNELKERTGYKSYDGNNISANLKFSKNIHQMGWILQTFST